MSPEQLQLAVLVATGAVLVAVPLSILMLASRIRGAAHDSMRAALGESSRQHQQSIGELRQQHDRTIAELAHQHERSLTELTGRHDRMLGEYARQHQRAIAELGAEHQRIAQEFGMFSRKRHEVYARLYSRYRRATHDLTSALTGHEPEFQKFARDDLLRYLKGRNIRERDAADAVAAMDRGDLFAMSKLMSKLHWRATLRDANSAFERAHQFEALNELYLSDVVRDAVGNVRRLVEALAHSLSREQERADPSKRIAKQDELHSAVVSLLHAMRNDLRSGSDARPRPLPELDRTTPSRGALAPRTGTQLADKPSQNKDLQLQR
jgi:hypothetical protein